MRTIVIAGATVVAVAGSTSTASAELPMGLTCNKSFKIASAEVGDVGEYEVKVGMKVEKHSALLHRTAKKAVDGCSFPDLDVGQTLVVRYTGPDLGDTEIQCIDQAHGDALVEFPREIYTVRYSRIDPWKLMPFCRDGKVDPSFGAKGTCSKKNTQSERATELKETVLGSNGKNPQKLVDLQFDPPYRDSVPSGAKLFCALVDRDGKVIIAASAQYPTSEPTETKPRERSR